jgi:uncharacterized membrane protein YeiB
LASDSDHNTALAPVAPGERIEIVDILRGFALFGILLVNMAFFSTSIFHAVVDFSLWTSPWDRAAEFFLIFYSYGLGYFGEAGPAAGLLLTIGIYALQIPFSNWWLGRFRFGPAEWVWRSLTYGRAQPMRIAD